jgi:hypothetical protein
VNGSGVCLNLVDIVRVADFSTQIVNNPSAVATYTGKGGNRFAFTLPKLDGIFSGNGVFNLASQRLFVIDAAGAAALLSQHHRSSHRRLSRLQRHQRRADRAVHAELIQTKRQVCRLVCLRYPLSFYLRLENVFWLRHLVWLLDVREPAAGLQRAGPSDG